MSITLKLEEKPSEDDVQVVRQGLSTFNHPHAGNDAYTPLTILIRDQEGTVVGGLLGGTYWGWMHIDVLWIDESLRGQDYGSRLLAMAEDEGRKRGCRKAHLDTMSFQAPEFYQKHGYEVWGVLEGIPEGHDRIFLRKALV